MNKKCCVCKIELKNNNFIKLPRIWYKFWIKKHLCPKCYNILTKDPEIKSEIWDSYNKQETPLSILLNNKD
jgi:hypothetical protein